MSHYSFLIFVFMDSILTDRVKIIADNSHNLIKKGENTRQLPARAYILLI